MLELKVFQSESARIIAARYAFFASHPDRPSKGPNKPRPFFQALSALTGAGKTPILAQAVTLMRAHFSNEPIVLWMSKARSVVAQTFTNFSGGGKYSEIIDDFRVVNIQNLRPELIDDGTTPLLLMTTTGLFNNKDQSAGVLNIYKRDADIFGDQSAWERLIERKYLSSRRPLIIVYDEGHNLSEQQTELLAELEPDAYLLASATLKLPPNFQKSVIQQIKVWVEETDATEDFKALEATNSSGSAEAERFITTAVNSAKVVEAELVKKAIQFDGTTAPMERCIDEMFKRLELIDGEIIQLGLGFKPKAIYVCKTNITDDGQMDDPAKPFVHRQAPPIRIWRYLVERKGVSPQAIAIYANLNFADDSKPDEVNLFSKGEKDFENFTEGDYQHIIFNLSLQEGWDDPACYLAYIDKSMGSSIQVEQTIGRVLRQKNAVHYERPILNSAHFFLRVDQQSVFTDAIQKVKAKLSSEGAPIEITQSFSSGGGGAEDLRPKSGLVPALHHVYVDSEEARQEISMILEDFPYFTEGDENTTGQAHNATQLIDLQNPSMDLGMAEWTASGHTNPVRLRWLVSSATRARSSRALAVVDLSHPKFDVRVQVQSKADKMASKLAGEIVERFYMNSDLVYESTRPFTFGLMRVPKNASAFSNALYDKYANFNKLEMEFALALDKTGDLWHRNPSNGGFHIPLLSEGEAASFFPDFLVWHKNRVFCLDTKGGHLLTDALARKLFDVKEDGHTKLSVRFISQGKQTALGGKATNGGYTVWKMKSGRPTPVYAATIEKAVAESLT